MKVIRIEKFTMALDIRLVAYLRISGEIWEINKFGLTVALSGGLLWMLNM